MGDNDITNYLINLVKGQLKDGKLPDEIEYKGKIYKAFNEISSETSGDSSVIYYINPKESEDYFSVKVKLNKIDTGYRGIKDISYVVDLTESKEIETSKLNNELISRMEDSNNFKYTFYFADHQDEIEKIIDNCKDEEKLKLYKKVLNAAQAVNRARVDRREKKTETEKQLATKKVKLSDSEYVEIEYDTEDSHISKIWYTDDNGSTEFLYDEDKEEFYGFNNPNGNFLSKAELAIIKSAIDDIKNAKEKKTESLNSFSDLISAGEYLWGEDAKVYDTDVDGIYSCYTARHGGYLVDIDKLPQLKKYGDSTNVKNIVGFEEDYEALKILWIFPTLIENKSLKDKLTLDMVLHYEDKLNDDFRKEFPKIGGNTEIITESQVSNYTLRTEARTKWTSYVKRMAKDDYSVGQTFSSDDYNEFKHIMQDDNFELSEEEYKKAWDYYWECYNNCLNESKEMKIESQVSNYTLQQIGECLKDSSNDFTMQISGSDSKTKWLNLDKEDVQKIYNALSYKKKKTENESEDLKMKKIESNEAVLFGIAEDMYNRTHKDKWHTLTDDEKAKYYNYNYKRIKRQADNKFKKTECSIKLQESVKGYNLVQADANKIMELREGSAFTWEGFINTPEQCDKLIDIFKKQTPDIKLPVTMYMWDGKLFNELYGLTQDNAYPDNLHFLAIPLDSWTDMGRLAMVKLRLGARWLDDIVDNNAARQAEINGEDTGYYGDDDDNWEELEEVKEIKTEDKEFNHISDVWEYLEQSKNEEDLENRINDIPRKFGLFTYELINGDETARVTNEYEEYGDMTFDEVDIDFLDYLDESREIKTEDQYESERRRGVPSIQRIAEQEYYDNKEWYQNHIKDYLDITDFVNQNIAEIASEYNLKDTKAEEVCKLVYKMAIKYN